MGIIFVLVGFTICSKNLWVLYGLCSFVSLFICGVRCGFELQMQRDQKKKKNTILIITCHNKEENEAIGFQ